MVEVRLLYSLSTQERKRIKVRANRSGNNAIGFLHPLYPVDEEMLGRLAKHAFPESRRGQELHFPEYWPAVVSLLKSDVPIGVLFETEEWLERAVERIAAVRCRKRTWIHVPMARNAGKPPGPEGFNDMARLLSECGIYHFQMAGAFFGEDRRLSGCVGQLIQGLLWTNCYVRSDFNTDSPALVRFSSLAVQVEAHRLADSC